MTVSRLLLIASIVLFVIAGLAGFGWITTDHTLGLIAFGGAALAGSMMG